MDSSNNDYNNWRKIVRKIGIAILCGMALMDLIVLHWKAMPDIMGAQEDDAPTVVAKKSVDEGAAVPQSPMTTTTTLPPLMSKQEQIEQRAELWKAHPEWISCKNERNDDSIPSFIIAGTQKGGTTALFHLLAKHPLLVEANYFELHFFDWEGGQPMQVLKQQLAELNHFMWDPSNTVRDVNTTRLQRLNQWTTKLQRESRSNNSTNDSTSIVQTICSIREDYRRYFNLSQAVLSSPLPLMAYEKTPVYVTSSETAVLIKLLAPWTKIVVMLRNPVDRAYSYYKMCRHTFRGDPCQRQSFEYQIEQEMEELIRKRNLSIPLLSHFREVMLEQNASSDAAAFYLGNTSRFHMHIPPPSHRFPMNKRQEGGMVRRGLYAEQLHAWMEWFELGTNLLVVSHEAFRHHPTKVFDQILTFLNVPPVSHGITHEQLLGHYEIPIQKDKRFKHYKHPPMDPITRDYLTRFFQPYNQQLDHLLQDHEEWKNMWT